MTSNTEQLIMLMPVSKEELLDFKQELKEAFMKGLKDSFPEHEDPTQIAPVPSEEDTEQLLSDPETVIHHLVMNGEKIGGAVLKFNEDTQYNKVQFLYLKAGVHGQGIGTKAWQAIEVAYPQTKVWELYTPYFEKRNIHFYVNKCGFKIVEFFHRGNPDSGMMVEETKPDAEYEFFRFEKVMKV